jgi:hypothetical protein
LFGDELKAEDSAHLITGGAGDDQFTFNAGSFQPDSPSLRDVVLVQLTQQNTAAGGRG